MDNHLNHAYNQSSELIIAGNKIRQVNADYYSIYNFHRASGRDDSKQPSIWLRYEQKKI
ncbi:hypothetical protein [Commensalibacter papalotli (ex Botero et al. 2024)]|uniref:hypothetical protein n=1 Tax=Commensalibacter papalotli (ex Botero et al. 2024) TaxID=2972766 RepID=UPI0024912E8B|nr:hypothetical protein [Commensalibacter papalotli (ex Botero et al. 2024)]